MVAIAAGANGQPPSTLCSDAAHAHAGPRNYTTNQLLSSSNYHAVAAAALVSYSDMLKNLINQYALANSGSQTSSIDMDGTSDYYKKYFSNLPPLSTDAGASDPVMRNETYTYKQTYRKFTCAYDEYANQDCRLDGQAISSNTITDTYTQTYTYQQRVGFVAKVKMGGYAQCFRKA